MERIGRYAVERALGSGAFGTVYLARDETIDANVAIKVLADNWAQNESVRQRFIDEARILFQIESDHIVRVHLVDELPDGRPYFVMEYADRGSLETRMTERFNNQGWFSLDEALLLSRDIAQGLKVAHAFGIAHRDLKPANVMFRSVPAHLAKGVDERLVLVDFGVAKSLATGGSTTIATGTPHYMAPEQSEGRADHRSDLYSAAVILYELLANRVPYPVDSIGALIRAQNAMEFPEIGKTIRGDVTADMDAAIRRAMSPDPSLRYPDADAWIAALDDPSSAVTAPVVAAAGGAGGAEPPEFDPTATVGPEELERMRASGQIPIVAATPPAAPPPVPPAPPLVPPPGPAPREDPRKKPRVGVAALAAFALVAAVIGGALVLGGGDKADGPAKEVFLKPISSIGVDPFKDVAPETKDVDTGDGRKLGDVLANVKLPNVDLPSLGGGSGGVPQIEGGTPGLYGGTNLLSVCDTNLLVQFLKENVDKAKAWAEVRGIDVDSIESYVGKLTDVVLQADTRITNHGFLNGVATKIDSILEKGTAVLVDTFGEPVVRCKCGNPLTAARPLASDVKISGDPPWPDFNIANTVTITPSPTPVPEFVVNEVVTNTPAFRVPASPASELSPTPRVIQPPNSSSSESSSTDSSTPNTELPTSGVTDKGTASASSTFNDARYLPRYAIDNDTSTSWFSAGGGSAQYIWRSLTEVQISSIEIVGNGDNPDFPTGFGFESVNVIVQDGDGNEVFRSTQSLAGTPDPTVTLSLNARGYAVVLEFSGGENPTCGGFSELRIFGST